MKNAYTPLIKMRAVVALAVFTATAPVRADFVTDTIPAGTNPYAVAINPVTNLTYIANYGSGTVTVINGATSDTAATIAVGSNPRAIAVNALTNKIYVANFTDSSVSIINGATNMVTATVSVQLNPIALAVNPATNKIYVPNYSSASVSVINGSSDAVDTTIAVGLIPIALCVNPVTDRIYVANSGSNSVTVINGATNAIATVVAGTNPYAIAANTVTNKIYVANMTSNTVTVIDGATNGTTTIAAGTNPGAVAVNSATDTIYVMNAASNSIMMIDGATGTVAATVTIDRPTAIAVNTTTNKVYVASFVNNSVSVITAATLDTTLLVGTNPNAVAVNTITNRIYTANAGSGNVTVVDGCTYNTAMINAGGINTNIAVNPVTNRIYVVDTEKVTVINGVTNATTIIDAGNRPSGIAINPVTDKIYVINQFTNYIMVIDGGTNAAVALAMDSFPRAIAVNEVTNKIYVSGGSNKVTVIDGATNATTTITVGNTPNGIAVNSVTNKIYVANTGSNNISVIDGLTNQTLTVAAGISPGAVAVNPVTNKIYVSNSGWSAPPWNNSITVIDGITNQTTTVDSAAQGRAAALAVNLVTNKIYVVHPGAYGMATGNIRVIDGISNQATTVTAGQSPANISINMITNKIYVSNIYSLSFHITVIDGATNTTRDIDSIAGPSAINLVTGKVYVANTWINNKVSVIDETQSSETYLAAVIDTLPNHVTYQATPVLSGRAVNRLRPGHTGVSVVLQYKNTAQYPWNFASISGNAGTDSLSWAWNWGSDSLLWGESFLCFAALDSQCVGTNNSGLSSPFNGNVSVYPIYRILPPSSPPEKPVLVSPSDNAIDQSVPVTFFWEKAAGASSYSLQVSSDSTFSSIVFNGSGIIDTFNSVSGLSNSMVYFWRVQAFSLGGISSWSSVRKFTTIPDAPPDSVVLFSPANGAVGVSTNPLLTWNAAARAGSYIVQASTASDFSSPVANDSGITSTTHTIASLSAYTLYYWRVKAVNAVGESGWSVVWNYMTGPVGPVAPSTPALVSPANGATDQPVLLTFIWNRDTLAAGYHVQVATDSVFSSLFADDSTLTDTLVSIGGLDSSGTYYWRVRGKNAGGASAWSEVRSFTTVTSGVLPGGQPTPLTFLIKSYPRQLSYSLPRICHVSVRYFNLKGRQVASLVNRVQGPGYYTLQIDRTLLSSGVYCMVFEAGSFVKRELVAMVGK